MTRRKAVLKRALPLVRCGQLSLVTGRVLIAALPKLISKSLKSEERLMSERPIVIVGSGLAGWTLARELRTLSADRPVTLVTATSGDFYSKPMLSNAFAQGKSPANLLQATGAAQAAKYDVTLMSNAVATSIDAAQRALQVGSDRLPYGDLVLALGAAPVRLQLPGSAFICSVNDWWDYAAFRDRMSRAPNPAAVRVVILGAGLIGCEFANDLAGAGHSVTLVDPGDRTLNRLVNEDDSVRLQTALHELGVNFRFRTTARAVDEAMDGTYTVDLADGTILVADVVLSAVGLRPQTALASAAGIEVTQGVCVDNMGQTSVPRVWALGDCAAYAQGVMPYVMPLMTAAKAMAKTLLGAPTPIVFPAMPVRIKTPACPLTVQA
jgi:rubredoxin-NAD+ reductase